MYKRLIKVRKNIVFLGIAALLILAVLSLRVIKSVNIDFYSQVIRGKGNIISNYKKYSMNMKSEELYYSKTLKKNARHPLDIRTYDGSNQPCHPDIVFNPNGIFDHKYWMAYTPYPYENDKIENPSIAVSDDGIHFTVPKGVKNPLDSVDQKIHPGGHLSDTDITFNNNELVLRYVYNVRGHVGPSQFYEMRSKNGVSWSKPNIIYQTSNSKSGYSPAFVNEKDGILKMWYFQSENHLMYTESNNNGMTWKPLIRCNMDRGNWNGWHVDIIKTDVGFEGLICARIPKLNQYTLYYARSVDGVNWKTSVYPLISPKPNSWDSNFIYRSTLLKVNDKYQIWYSACNKEYVWHIAHTQFSREEIDNLNMM